MVVTKSDSVLVQSMDKFASKGRTNVDLVRNGAESDLCQCDKIRQSSERQSHWLHNLSSPARHSGICSLHQCRWFHLTLILIIFICGLSLLKVEGAGVVLDEKSRIDKMAVPWSIITKAFDMRVCAGTHEGLQSRPAKFRYDFLRERYTNCTYVNGNLEITFLDDPTINYDLGFLENIREVTGYVLIAYVYADYVPLKKLEIIRGQTLFSARRGEPKKYSLYVVANVKPNDKNVGLKELRFINLREILRGEIMFHNNNLLCYENQINWQDILDGDVNFKFDSTYYRRPCTTPCVKACDVDGRRLCWGSGPDYCQTLFKKMCSPQCDGRCFGPNPNQCCHAQCAAGCTGPRKSECRACQNFFNDGQCEPFCPPLEIYDKSEFKTVPNPNARYTYGSICVKKCPDNMLTDRSACVKSCPPDKLATTDLKCVPCDGPCPKKCPGMKSEYLDEVNIHNFTNCTIIDGNLRILKTTFDNDPYKNLTALDPAKLFKLSTVKEITGYLTIQHLPLEVKNLSFLGNLEKVSGRDVLSTHLSFSILYTSITSLGLKSLRSIMAGGVMIFDNRKLCYAMTVKWEKIIKDPKLFTIPNKYLYLKENRKKDQCDQDAQNCSVECDGCWGPGNSQCQACNNYTFNGLCIGSCKSQPRLYDAGNKTCKKCDDECSKGCRGPGPRNCTGDCKNFNDGPVCVSTCPIQKYPDTNKQCQPCHENCVGGCTGPANNIGKGACNKCGFLKMKEDGNTIDECLDKNPTEYFCPDGYYLQPGQGGKDTATPTNMWKGLPKCFKCHKLCKTCLGYGTYSCPICHYYRFQHSCFSECPTQDTYPMKKEGFDIECGRCHVQCKRGCDGASSTQCKYCANVKIVTEYQDDVTGEIRTTHNCTQACPEELPYVESDPETGEDLCVGELNSSKMNIVIGASVACILIVIIGIIIIAYWCRQRMLAKENMLKLTARMSGYDESVPLTPTDAKPDLAKLRLIKESELRKGGIIGSGAFGTVYKGVWVPEGENVKIPVAIKVLSEGTCPSQNKELLEEARIMTSVDNTYCIRILAVCMTAQMMLVSQLMPLGCLLDYVRKNKANIGSKALLNWCTQIAKGMTYLEDRAIVHRDLAARNVLVQSPTLVKITDFGLAKLLDYDEEEYHAAGGKMPIKWLALECIQHRVFTHKSDVWSYGVTVWELFTYGQRPYENVRARDVPDLLEKGERLPQPSICTIDVYMIMIKCWMLDAESRPSFRELADEFEKMARDPGRYLVITGDKLMRLPSHNVDTQDLVRNMSIAVDGPEEVIDAEEYLMPKSTETTDEIDSPVLANGMNGISNGKVHIPSDYDERTPANSPARENQFLITPTKRDKKYAHLEGNFNRDRGSNGGSRYSSDPCKILSTKDPRDDHNDFLGRDPMKDYALHLPVDEDYYLTPKSSKPAHYMDIIDTDMYCNPRSMEPNSVDNPEYFQNGHHDNLPASPTSETKLRLDSSSPDSDVPGHEYYNEYNRLQQSDPSVLHPGETTV
ncbi:epidermal growth factor receptor-like isoform X2 [Lineus longissimus]|uniref:epidermal growth factor receptor-like isoform X2 n=1 Tax=Lineus longissimus TaxID=88925 RepID=UPI00315D5A6A